MKLEMIGMNGKDERLNFVMRNCVALGIGVVCSIPALVMGM